MERAACLALLYLFVFVHVDAAVSQNLSSSSESEENSETGINVRSLLKPVETPERLAKFFLYTPKAVKTSQILDATNSQSLSNFDTTLDTKIIIHGFLDSAAIAPWMQDMKDEFLTYGDYNVIIVDWSAGNSIPYSRAAENAEKVGQEISELLIVLFNERDGEPETIHLIGHSLGAHVAGFVGEYIEGIGRISGLDPASPRFENEDPEHRLDPSDAIFVDILHTDAAGIGMIEPTGHQDFYPNGGRVQPGCTASNALRSLIKEGIVEGARNVICSHTRATLLYTATINSRECEMTGVLCDSWEEFKDGQCMGCGASGERCAVMGFHANSQTTGQNRFHTYYLLTTSQKPYCAHEYKVTFEVEVNDNSQRGGRLRLLNALSDLPVIGNKALKLSVHGSEGTSEFELDDDRFGSSSKHVTYMVPSKIYFGIIDWAVAEWMPKGKSARVLSAVTRRKLTTPLIRRIEITPVKDLSQSGNLSKTYILCSRETTELNKKITFRSDRC